ncbi:MAG: metal-dependent hydrolase [Terriglobales bacterium]
MFNTRGVQITWLGQSTYRIGSGGKTFYLDPFLTPNPLCPENEKNPSAADFILVTHGHSDHTSDLVALAKRTQARVVCMLELGLWLIKQGVPEGQIMACHKGGTVELAGTRVTMVHADHSSSFTGADGLAIYLGEAAGYIMHFAEGLRAYFAGDTAVFGDMRLLAEIYKPEVAFLPIGDFFTMGPLEAAHACRLLAVAYVVPNHFATFPVLTGSPAELRHRLQEAGTPCEVCELKPGQTI